MTIPSGSISTGPLAGDSSNNLWPFAFSVASADEVEVVRTSAAGGDAIITEGFTVSLTGDGSLGGRVVYPTSSERVPDGDSVTIRLAPAFDQPIDLKSQGDYSPEVVESALDHVVRQTKRLRHDQGRMVQSGAGITLDNVLGAPIDGRPLSWRLNGSGSWSIIAGELSRGAPATIRVIYSDDLGLKGDGTDESDAINTALLSYQGQNVIIHLRAEAGYWPISKPIENRSGIALSWGSTARATNRGCFSMAGTVSRLAAAATLTVAATAGATTISAAAVSGVLSGSYVLHDQVAIGSGGVNNLYRITGINDAGSLTFTPALRADAASGSTVRKLVFTYCTAGWARHDTPTELPVASVSDFAVGDMVWVTDDETITHLNGVDTRAANSEQAMVLGFGAGTIKLDRPIKHWCQIGNRPRVVKIDPCRNASISGASIEFVQAPDGTQVDVFTATFAYQCQYLGCRVPNMDNYGTRGCSFLLRRCLDSEVAGCYAGPAKYFDSGESYGVSLIHCTGCLVTNLNAVGTRHALSFSGSTDCVGRGITASGWRVNMVDYHGLKEIGCYAYAVDGAGNSDYAGAVGVCCGNPSWNGGTYECGVIGGEITDLEGTEGAGIRINAPVDACNIQAVTFRRCTEGIRAQNFQGDAALASGRMEITCDFHRCGSAGVIDMNRFGGTAKPFSRLDLDGSRFYDWAVGLRIDNVADVVAAKIVMQTTRATVGEYAVALDNCGAARIGGTFDGCQKHLTSKDTPVDLAHYEVRNPNTTTLWDETSASPVSGCRDVYGKYPDGWVPARSSPSTTISVYSLPGMA